MKYCSNKDIDKLIRKLIRKGWKFRRGSKHGRLLDPTGSHVVIVASSPSDHRGYKNFVGELRRASEKTLQH